MTAKTTRITVETETLLVIRRAKTVLARCPECHAEVEVITVDNDALAEPVMAAQFQEWLGTSKLHLCRTANGTTQICLISLVRNFELQEIERFFSSIQNSLDQSRRKQP